MEINNLKIGVCFRLILVLLFLFFPSKNTSAKKYYVNSLIGKDNNSGIDTKNPWKTISKINNITLQPGDSILLRSGCLWREELRIPSNGSNAYPIYFGKYGKGDSPKIYGSKNLTNWEKYSNNIWKIEIGETPGWLWFLDQKVNWGKKVENFNALKKKYDFFIEENSIFIFLLKSPDNYYSIEASVRDFGIISGWYGKGKDFITLENIEIGFTKNANIRAVGSNNWIVKKTNLHHSGAIDETDGQGIQWEGKNAKFIENKIYENGQHGIFISSFGNCDVENNLIEGNEIYNNYHTAVDLMNDGGNENSHAYSTISRNLIYDEKDFLGKEIGIQTLGYGLGKIKNVTIHHNVILNLKGIGISIMKNSDNIFIHNNSIIETESACVNIDNNLGNVEIVNNVGLNNKYYAVLFLHNISNKYLRNNIWYTSNGSSTKNVFVNENYYSNFDEYSVVSPESAKSSFNNPELIIIDKKITLRENSICVNAGMKMNYKDDFYGNRIDEQNDIGAIEFIED